MDYTSMMQGVAPMGMPYNMVPRPHDMGHDMNDMSRVNDMHRDIHRDMHRTHDLIRITDTHDTRTRTRTRDHDADTTDTTSTSRPRHAYAYPYHSDPVFLMPQVQRTMAAHQSMAHAKQAEPKPRLTKDEVQLLEGEFTKNPKPSSHRKREIAEQLKVDNSRINNWFQNRRAKAKQILRREADPRAARDESPSASSPSNHPDDAAVSEYYGANQQSLPLRTSSASFPTGAMDQHALALFAPTAGTVAHTTHDGRALSHSTSPASADEYPSPGSHHQHEMAFAMGDYLAQHQHPHQHQHQHQQHSHAHVHAYEPSLDAFESSLDTFEPSLDAFVPYTSAAAAAPLSMDMEPMAPLEPMAPMVAQVGSLLTIDPVARPPHGTDRIVLPQCDAPTQLDPNRPPVPSPGSARAHAHAARAPAAAPAAAAPALCDLRLKSPPPPANLASRRNQGAPSLLNAAAFRTAAAHRVHKHSSMSAAAAPRSPLVLECRTDARAHSLHMHIQRASASDDEPLLSCDSFDATQPPHGDYYAPDALADALAASPASSYHGGLSLPVPPTAPSWARYADDALLTPSLGSYGAAADYAFPRDSLAGLSDTFTGNAFIGDGMMPSETKNKMQFTLNIPEDYF